jgi:hypothetical protein
MRAKIRTEPEEVEAWFDREAEKVHNANIKDIIKNFTEKENLARQLSAIG